ncbi:hypothetical protein VTK73DRAFT_5564 [Phialemonium thermophilum]|uniref:Methyltransferase domain-containing protein n=1 Tax=Phialemonium thermophilum TaxID=223376 RepID=A0ABR3XX16_9PEZI
MAEQGSDNNNPPEPIAAHHADDVGDDDDDEGLGLEPYEPSTASLRSSILQYRTEHGRTYHAYKDGKYSLPNDDTENERLDLQHHIFCLSYDGRLGLCPLNDPGAKVGRVLDVGCGTGIWTIDYGDEHPEAEVIGVDLSPIQPSFTPPNVRFEIDDLEEPWTFSQKFDYIHSRIMTTSFSDWKAYLQKCYDNLNPGGYLELADVGPMYVSDDGTLTEDHAVWKWRSLLVEAAKALGRPFTDPKTYKGLLEEVGFVDVHETLHRWPVNTWPQDKKLKEIGAWNYENIMIGMEGFSLAFLSRGLGWSREEIDTFLVDVRKCLRDRRIHTYVPLTTVYGKKPAT